MCGICGILLSPRHEIDPGHIHAMSLALAHRGPDGDGMFVDKNLGLGHRRLAILDTSPAGKQPMRDETGRFTITYNGEIYNFVELRAELEALGHNFETRSDTEVILAAYARWGSECLTRFNGMWAFAIWDARERELFLARDRFGVKPLYYYFHDGVFAFASECKAFLKVSIFELSVNDDGFASAIRTPLAFEASPRTLLNHVHKVSAGHFLHLRESGVPKVARWWNTLDAREHVSRTFHDDLEEFRELFLDACSLRMRSDIPIGTTLSGGLDSSSVMTALHHLRKTAGDARWSTGWQKAVTACFKGYSSDERDFAASVVERTSADVTYREITPQDIVDSFEKILFHTEEINDHSVVYWLTYQALRRAGVSVSIDGHGSDEMLAGYPWHLFSSKMDAHLWPNPMPERVAAIDKGLALLLDSRQPDTSSANFDQWFWSPPAAPVFQEFEAEQYRLSGMDVVNRGLFYDFHCATLPGHLRIMDHCSMAHGVEVRMPFLDWRLVKFCFSLPADSKIRDGWTKYILREALRDLLPAKIAERRAKIGFGGPFQEWFSGPLREFFLDLLRSKDFAESPISKGETIASQVEAALKQTKNGNLMPAWRHLQGALLRKRYQSELAV